jgi:hypothetical protein
VSKQTEILTGKPLKNWTVGAVQDFCAYHHCDKCLLYTLKKRCRFKGNPDDWDLPDQSRFTEQEVEDAKTLMRMYPRYDSIRRHSELSIALICNGDIRGGYIHGAMFPSIKEGETVKLSDIAGGE